MKRLVIVAGVVWSLAGTARADQCQVVDRETATWAARVITPGSMVATFCAPCGDRTPKPPTEVKKVTVDAAGTHVSINGTVVGSAPKADVVAAGKLKSTDGVYGIRFGHNTEATVSGLTMVKK